MLKNAYNTEKKNFYHRVTFYYLFLGFLYFYQIYYLNIVSHSQVVIKTIYTQIYYTFF